LEISLKLILDELGYEYELHEDGGDPHPRFESVEFLAASGSDLSGRTLLVCPLSEALALPERGRGLYFLCVRDRMVDERETPEAMRGILVIRRNMDLRELFNEIQRIFARIGGWVLDMQSSVAKNEGIRQLIALSEAVIGNHIAVMDPTFKLLAFTENVDIDDPASKALIELGYHTEETMERFKLHRRFEQYEKEENIIVSDDYAASRYVTVKKVFHNRDSYSVIVVMLCNVKPLSDGLLDLFALLIDAMEIYVKRDYPADGESGAVTALIHDLLEMRIESLDEARSRAASVGLAALSDYDLFLIHFEDTMNIPLNRLLQRLSGAIPRAYIVSWQRDILILNLYEGVRVLDREARMALADGVLTGLDADCGVSARFEELCNLPAAFEQAENAIRLGVRLRDRETIYTEIPDHGPWFFFEDYALFHQASLYLAQCGEGYRNTFAFSAICTLADNDRARNTSWLCILFTYLQCERRATETCARLHMHRNTVLYHIRRIEEALSVSLDDPEVRLRLLMGYKILELESADSAEAR